MLNYPERERIGAKEAPRGAFTPARRISEYLNGVGKVFKEYKLIATVDYHLIVEQEFSISASSPETKEKPGQKSVIGNLYVIQGDRNLTDGSVLSLLLSDNRILYFVARSGSPLSNNYKVVNAIGYKFE